MTFIPSIDPVKAEQRKLHVAASCAGLLGVLFLLSGVTLIADDSGNHARWIGIVVISESFLCLLLSYGLAKQNRVAAILFMIYVFPAILPLFLLNSDRNFGITIFAIMFFYVAARAVLAAFRLQNHRFGAPENPG